MNSLDHSHQRQSGFTLIEIMVVMVIIGILASMSLGTFLTSQQKSRDSQRKSDLKQIRNSLDMYFNDKGQYPVGSNGLIMGCNNAQTCQWGSAFQDQHGTVYMIQLPQEQQSDQIYRYESSTGQNYQLYARLENIYDRDIPKDSNNDPQKFSGLSCGTLECNYGVSSTNTLPSTGRTLADE